MAQPVRPFSVDDAQRRRQIVEQALTWCLLNGYDEAILAADSYASLMGLTWERTDQGACADGFDFTGESTIEQLLRKTR